MAGCAWNEEVCACRNAGQKPPCELYYVDVASGEKCPAGCEYSAAIEKMAAAEQHARAQTAGAVGRLSGTMLRARGGEEHRGRQFWSTQARVSVH